MGDEAQFKEAIAGKMKDKSQREALAQLIVEYVQPNHITADFVSRILNTRTMNINDTLVKKVRKGIKVWTWVPGSIALKSEVTVSERMNWTLDAAVVGVMANEWELENGEIGTAADLKAEALAKLQDYYYTKVHSALSSIWTATNTPDNFTDVGGVVTQTALEDMINKVNKVTPGAKAIFGVRSSLLPILKFGAFWGATGSVANPATGSQTKIDEILNSGFLGNYLGVPIVAVNQVYDSPDTHVGLLPTDKILVIGQNVGEFITYGPERSKEWTDYEPTPPYWHLDIVQQFGMIIDNAQGIGVLKVTAS